MATFKAMVFPHHLKEDGTYNVKIRVTHKGKQAYNDTQYYVTAKQIKKVSGRKYFVIRESDFLIDKIADKVKRYREVIRDMGDRVHLYSARELADHLEKVSTPGRGSGIDFIQFSRAHVQRLRKNGDHGNADIIETTINSLVDFFAGRERVEITEITTKSLARYEEYLRSHRTIIRNGVKYDKKPLSDTSVFGYLKNVRTLFNAARDEFNNEDTGEIRIIHYPFRKFKIPSPPSTVKRTLDIGAVRAIRDFPDLKRVGGSGPGRATLARDVSMLSFYLVGMNSVDLYNVDSYEDGRITYYRAKTASRRRDRAFISIRVPDEALPLMEKYKDPTGQRVFNFYRMYSTPRIFNSNINKGLKQIAMVLTEAKGLVEKYRSPTPEAIQAFKNLRINGEDVPRFFSVPWLGSFSIKIPLQFYCFRHCVGDWAKNKCSPRFPTDEIALALNHVDQLHKTTNIYVGKDWSIVDEIQDAVIGLIM